MKPKKFNFPNLGKDEMVIGAYVEPRFYGPDAWVIHDVTIDEAFDDMKDAGFNTLLNTYYFLNLDTDDIVMDIIEHMEKRGMNLLVKDHKNIYDRSHEDAKKWFKSNYEKLEKYKAFAGLHVIDEPGYVDWEKFGRLKKAFKEVYPDKLYYINLLQTYSPHWAIPNGAVYDYKKGGGLPDDGDIEKYYKMYNEIADPEVFSYDFYPCIGKFPNVLKDYFLQLHLAYKYAREKENPLFCFIQISVWGGGTRRLTLGELMWQVNMALAYNTKGLAYYCYWTSAPNQEFNAQGFIDWWGNKTPSYHLGKKCNEHIKYIDEYMVNSDFKGYMYCGVTPNGEIPNEEERIESFGKLKSFKGGNLFVGCFDYYKTDVQTYYMYYVVNNDIVNEAFVTLNFTEKVNLTVVNNMRTRTLDSDKVRFKLPAGHAALVIVGLDK